MTPPPPITLLCKLLIYNCTFINLDKLNILWPWFKGVSDRKVLKFLTHVRRELGRQVITPNIQKLLTKRKSIYDDFFRRENLEFEIIEDKEKTLKTRPFYYCTDLKGLIEYQTVICGCEAKDLTNNIGFDAGKGVLKMIWQG